MIGYVAKDDDGTIWFHRVHPKYLKDSYYGGWFSGLNSFELPRDEYPEFQSIIKPIKVEINIKIKEDETL